MKIKLEYQNIFFGGLVSGKIINGRLKDLPNSDFKLLQSDENHAYLFEKVETNEKEIIQAATTNIGNEAQPVTTDGKTKK
jgi:hypothetical protein